MTCLVVLRKCIFRAKEPIEKTRQIASDSSRAFEISEKIVNYSNIKLFLFFRLTQTVTSEIYISSSLILTISLAYTDDDIKDFSSLIFKKTYIKIMSIQLTLIHLYKEETLESLCICLNNSAWAFSCGERNIKPYKIISV